MTIYSTWKSESPGKLLGCGVDTEQISRFMPRAGDIDAFPFVFSKRERIHCSTQDRPALALCAAFCCKEALFKALKKPYNFTDCELRTDLKLGPNPVSHEILIAKELLSEHKIAAARASLFQYAGFVAAVVHLYGACDE